MVKLSFAYVLAKAPEAVHLRLIVDSQCSSRGFADSIFFSCSSPLLSTAIHYNYVYFVFTRVRGVSY